MTATMQMKQVLLAMALIGCISCGKQRSAFTCYICKTTAIADSDGVKTYRNLPDFTKCNVDKSKIDAYQAGHNVSDSLLPGIVIDTVTLCSQF